MGRRIQVSAMVDSTAFKKLFYKILKRIRFIHLALLGGLLFIALLSYNLQRHPVAEFASNDTFLIFLVPVAALGGYFGGIYIFNKLMGSLYVRMEPEIRFTRYQTASLLKYTCLELPALLSLFAYIRQGYLLYAATAIFLIIYFVAQRPSKRHMLENIPLSDEEKQTLT